jgi:hypothetical protein
VSVSVVSASGARARLIASRHRELCHLSFELQRAYFPDADATRVATTPLTLTTGTDTDH